MASRATAFEQVLSQDLTPQILTHLSEPDTGNLRLVSRAARASVNAAVTKVHLHAGSPSFRNDFEDIFPGARALRIRCEYRPVYGRDFPWDHFSTSMATYSPAFLTRLQQLNLHLGYLTSSPSLAPLCSLLTRCTRLEEVMLAWVGMGGGAEDSHAVFSGQDSSPAEKRASMQQQLAALCADPIFLAPSSWASLGCLRELHLDGWQRFPADVLKSYANAAVQATSLHTLQFCQRAVINKVPWQGISCLAGSLTRLCLSPISFTFEEMDEVHDAVARLTSLVVLEVCGIVLGEAEEFAIPQSWSQLSRLAQLRIETRFDHVYVALHPWPCFPALRRLQLPQSASFDRLAVLFSATLLTSLVCGFGYDYEEEQAAAVLRPGSGAAGLLVPQQWKAGLRELEWSFTWHNMGLIAQLSSLTRLVLNAAPVGPTLCRALAVLPSLKSLWLPNATIDEEDAGCSITTGSPGRLGTLASLTSLTFDDGDVLVMLARWTNVPSGLTLVEDTTDDSIWRRQRADWPSLELLSVAECGAGWVAALLPWLDELQMCLFLPDDTTIWPFEQAVTTQTAAMGGCESFAVALGRDITATGFSRVRQAGQALPECLAIAHNIRAMPIARSQPEPAVMQALPSAFFRQLEGVAFDGLKKLSLSNCSLLTVLDAAALARAVPNLAVLELEQATGATDAMVCTFVACRLLAALSVLGCSKVTRDAAVMLASMLPVLRWLEVEGVCCCRSRKMCQQLVGMGAQQA